MAFLDELKDYIDQYGLVQNRIPNAKGWTSGNGLLFTGEASIIASALGEWNCVVADRFFHALVLCQVASGVYERIPGNRDQEGPDDYFGIGATAFYLNTYCAGHFPNLAAESLAYGRKNPYKWHHIPLRYYFPNAHQTEFDVSAWMGRFPALIAHLQFAAGENPALWKKIWWCVSIMIAHKQPTDNKDARILSWVMIHVMAKRSWLCNKAAAFFYKRLYTQYIGGMKQVFSEYFGADHPIAKYAVTE